jgi:metallo-beta-lactamase family protein
VLRMHGMEVPVRAQVLAVHGLSGHADQDELLRWIQSGERLPRRAFITHGEPEAAAALAQRLERELHLDAHVARMGELFELG